MQLSVVLITISVNLILGFLSYRNNPKSWTNRLLTALALIISVWAYTNYFSLNSTNTEDTLFWIRMVMLVTAPLGPIIFIFLQAFPSRELKINPLVNVILILLTVITGALAFTPYMFSSVSIDKLGIHPEAGPAIAIYGLLLSSTLLAGFVTIVKKYHRSAGLVRLQLKYLVMGVILTFSLQAITNFVFVILLNMSQLVVLGPSFSLILIGFIFYAIVKHQLLDISLVVARAIAYSLLILVIGLFYVGSAFILGSLVFGPISVQRLTLYALLTIIVAFSFDRIRSVIEKLTDRVLYKGKYDIQQVLSELGIVMNNNIELAPLTSQILYTLVKQIRISKGAFILLGELSIYDIISVGFQGTLNLTYPQIAPFLSQSESLIFDELEESSIKQLMRDTDVSVVKLLKVRDKIIGLLMLGEKSSGEIYSQQDLKLLDIAAPEIAVAIQNSQSYDRIKKFNVILSEEIKKATTDLRGANSRLQELDKLKDDFVSITSHELRTPMTAIRSYSWMALYRSDIPLSEKMKKYLSRTLISTERLINLVNDLLNISRIEAGRIEVTPKPFNMVDLVKDVVEEVKAKANEKQIQLLVTEEKIPEAFADSDKIHQILLNLIGNSLKFTPENGQITISFFSDGIRLETSITDTGTGISKDDLTRLFQKFGRLDNSYTAAATSGGSGLGLYICKSLMQLMHGTIWAQSEGLGKGSKFTFSLPIATQDVLQHADQYRFKPAGEVKQLEPEVVRV